MEGSEQTRRQQILEAALRVFATEGYHKASIRRIAHEAGLKSPPLVYWYFKDKNELFEAVLFELTPLLQQFNEIAGSRDDPPREVLARILIPYVAALKNPDFERLFRIFLSEVGHTPDIGVHFLRNGLLMMVDWLVVYFQHQIELGNLRPHDPKVSAYAFLGMMGSFILGRDILLAPSADLPDLNEYVQGAVSILLDGLEYHAREPVSIPDVALANTPPNGEGGKG